MKKLLLKVSKLRYLSFSGRFSVVLPGLSDRPVRPAGLPLDGGFVVGSSHGPAWGNGESLVRVRPGLRAWWVVVGHARLVRWRLINCAASRRSRRVPSVGFLSALICHLYGIGGKAESFSVRLSPFLICWSSSLNRERERGSRPLLILPLSRYLFSLFFSTEYARASRRILGERGGNARGRYSQFRR